RLPAAARRGEPGPGGAHGRAPSRCPRGEAGNVAAATTTTERDGDAREGVVEGRHVERRQRQGWLVLQGWLLLDGELLERHLVLLGRLVRHHAVARASESSRAARLPRAPLRCP